MNDPFDTSAARLAGVTRAGAVGDAVAARAKVLDLTQAAERAVIAPDDPGGLSPALRAALATRICRAGGAVALAAHYGGQGAAADPDAMPDGRDGTIAAFVDAVAMRPRDVEAGDVAALQAAGMPDADIVRLCELVAFVAYQMRLVHGLALMGQGT